MAVAANFDSKFILQPFVLMRVATNQKKSDGANPWIMEQFLGVLYGGLVSYQFSQVLVKISLIYQYRRLFTTWAAQKKTFFLFIWMIIYGSASILLSVFHCWPISNFWSDPGRSGCAPLPAVSEFLTISNVVNNILIWCFPLFYIVPLKLPRRQDKRRLLVLFGAALL